MVVSITWSLTNGGVAITEPLDHGTDDNGTTLGEQEIFLRHDGVNPISNAGFYLSAYSTTYTGGATAADDLTELFAWGDGLLAADFGGVQLNMDATGGYPATWPAFGAKSGTNYNVFRTGVGDTGDNKILLAIAMGLDSAAGTLQAGATPNVRFKSRIAIPSDTSTAGLRQFDQRLRYSYTS